MKKIIYISLLAVSCFSTNSFATGIGAIAGSVSMIANAAGDKVTDVATSIAIGKSNAHANASSTATTVSTFAGGTGGAMALTNGALTTITPEIAAGLDAVQTNTLDGTISIDSKAGTYTGDAVTPTPPQ